MSWTIHPISKFKEHIQRWDQLLGAFGHAVFLESAFVLPLLEEFGKDFHLMLALDQDRSDQPLRAAAIVFRSGPARWETFQPSQLPLGCWMSVNKAQTLEQQAAELMRALPGFALSLSLTQLDSLLSPRPPDSARLRTQDYIETAWIEVEGDFDSYWESRGKNLRQNTKKQRNKLGSEGVITRLECLSDPTDVAQAIEDYGSLESAGWKGGDGTAVHPGNAQGRFYCKMLQNYCRLGRGRIYRYWFGDKLVSMDLCIDTGQVIIILKTAYDESYRSVSPSTLMRQEQFQQLFEQASLGRIEFYGKVMEWHTRWSSNVRSIYHLTCFRWTWVAAAHARLTGLRRQQVPINEPVAIKG